MPATDVLSRADAGHLLRRAGFGGSDAELTAFTGLTRAAAVDIVLGFTAADPAPQGPDVGVPAFVGNPSQWEAHRDGLAWWVQRMADLPNPTALPGAVPTVAADTPIWERMALFWHEHFSCGQSKVGDFPQMWDQVAMFRRMALGGFEPLLRATALHPAMLVFLDNRSNTVDGVQENFARELMELYTCGVGNFDEADVVAMARAWTGHNTVGWTGSRWDATYVYRRDRHDHGTKNLFGIGANWNGVAVDAGESDTLTELVFGVRQMATSRFIARKLFRWLAHLSPSDAVVDELATVFRDSGMQIAPLVRAILLHEEFWGSDARWGLVKSPAEFVTTLARRSGLPVADMGLRWSMEPTGQILFDPRSVAGWGQGKVWLGTAQAWARGGFARSQRWHAQDAGLLATLRDEPDSAVAAQRVLDLFGIEEASGRSRAALERWHARTVATSRWSAAPQGFLVGALLPEFQVY